MCFNRFCYGIETGTENGEISLVIYQLLKFLYCDNTRTQYLTIKMFQCSFKQVSKKKKKKVRPFAHLLSNIKCWIVQPKMKMPSSFTIGHPLYLSPGFANI